MIDWTLARSAWTEARTAAITPLTAAIAGQAIEPGEIAPASRPAWRGCRRSRAGRRRRRPGSGRAAGSWPTNWVASVRACSRPWMTEAMNVASCGLIGAGELADQRRQDGRVAVLLAGELGHRRRGAGADRGGVGVVGASVELGGAETGRADLGLERGERAAQRTGRRGCGEVVEGGVGAADVGANDVQGAVGLGGRREDG